MLPKEDMSPKKVLCAVFASQRESRCNNFQSRLFDHFIIIERFAGHLGIRAVKIVLIFIIPKRAKSPCLKTLIMWKHARWSWEWLRCQEPKALWLHHAAAGTKVHKEPEKTRPYIGRKAFRCFLFFVDPTQYQRIGVKFSNKELRLQHAGEDILKKHICTLKIKNIIMYVHI